MMFLDTATVLPFAYLGGLGIILYFAGKTIKGRETASVQEYEELSEQYYVDDPSGCRILQVALMKRAMECVKRVMRLQQEKPPLQQMVREGVIGESLWEKLLAAEIGLEQEMKDLMEEANIYKSNWGATLLQEASQLAQRQMQIQAQLDAQNDANDQQPAAAVEDSGSPAEETALSEEEKRQMIAQELIDEEEREKEKEQPRKRKNSKDKKK
ncbi:translocation protein S66 [Kappamyces sp. JEL0680]|nr:translocation protein S66 [Kappamyces sp. JEL0680]